MRGRRDEGDDCSQLMPAAISVLLLAALLTQGTLWCCPTKGAASRGWCGVPRAVPGDIARRKEQISAPGLEMLEAELTWLPHGCDATGAFSVFCVWLPCLCGLL